MKKEVLALVRAWTAFMENWGERSLPPDLALVEVRVQALEQAMRQEDLDAQEHQ